jgi:predicted unusual protein kinase regulating ubiquinone biosynthesis (AarF/ABC1/UbiB family)
MILLLTAFWKRDADFLSEVILMLSGTTELSEPEAEAFRRDIRTLMAKYRDESVSGIQFGPVLQELIEVSFRHHVPLPASLTLTAKTLAQMQQVASELDPGIDPFDVAGRFLMRSMVGGVVAKGDAKTLFYQFRKFRFRALRFAEAMERLVGASAGQRLELNFRVTSLENTIRRAGRRLALGITGGFASLASVLAAISEHSNVWAFLIFGLAGVALMVALAADLLTRHEPPERTSRTGAPEAS